MKRATQKFEHNDIHFSMDRNNLKEQDGSALDKKRTEAVLNSMKNPAANLRPDSRNFHGAVKSTDRGGESGTVASILPVLENKHNSAA